GSAKSALIVIRSIIPPSYDAAEPANVIAKMQGTHLRTSKGRFLAETQLKKCKIAFCHPIIFLLYPIM
ncbi:MAG: hypothetical protein IKL84_07235, partial [Clostridia bacterium]|nr:hypothetical protein [Clostridia bacterium]